MKSSSKARQAGISFVGLIFVVAVLAGVGVLVAQAIPTALEYQTILKAVDNAKAGSNAQEIRNLFDKAAAVDDIKSITGKDLEITKANDRPVVKFAYTKEIHMFGPAFLLLKYAGQSK